MSHPEVIILYVSYRVSDEKEKSDGSFATLYLLKDNNNGHSVVTSGKHRASALTKFLVNWVPHLAKNTVYINQFSNQSIDYMVIATKRVAWDHKVWWHLHVKLSKKDTKKLSPVTRGFSRDTR